jgi:hypothetical protein
MARRNEMAGEDKNDAINHVFLLPKISPKKPAHDSNMVKMH